MASSTTTTGLVEGWSLEEEEVLLGAVERCGPGAWGEVARVVGGQRTARELEEHFTGVFVEGRCSEPAIVQASFAALHTPPPPCSALDNALPHLAPRERPPRPPARPPGAPSTALGLLAGYSAARGDFTSPPDPQAEQVVAGLGAPEGALEEELHAALVSVYNRRLAGRRRTYRIVREHGLLARPRPRPWARLAALRCPADLLLLTEGLAAERQLRAAVQRLQELRRRGITLLGTSALLRTLEDRRREHAAVLQEDEGGRRAVQPLDIVGLPAFQRLTEEERLLSRWKYFLFFHK